MSDLSPQMKTQILDFLKENLSLRISEKSDIVDRSYGEYASAKNFKISLYLGDDLLSEDTIYT